MPGGLDWSEGFGAKGGQPSRACGTWDRGHLPDTVQQAIIQDQKFMLSFEGELWED